MVTVRAIVEELDTIQVVEVLTDAELETAKDHAYQRQLVDASSHTYYVCQDEPGTICVGDCFPLHH